MTTNSDFWPQDDQGYLLNDASWDKVKPGYYPVIDTLKSLYTHHLGDNLRGIYLFGSVARGKATPYSSDLDNFALVKDENVNIAWFTAESIRFVTEYPIVGSIQFELLQEDKDLDTTLYNHNARILATQGTCIYGENIIPSLPRYKPDIPFANDELVQLKPDLQEAKHEIEQADSPEKITYWCRRILKNTVRDSLFLVMDKEHKYTPNPELCAETFTKYYPDKSAEIDDVLRLINIPTSNKQELVHVLDSWGAWLSTEVDEWLDKYNPERKEELPLA